MSTRAFRAAYCLVPLFEGNSRYNVITARETTTWAGFSGFGGAFHSDIRFAALSHLSQQTVASFFNSARTGRCRPSCVGIPYPWLSIPLTK
jgi:hypothetical protein